MHIIPSHSPRLIHGRDCCRPNAIEMSHGFLQQLIGVHAETVGDQYQRTDGGVPVRGKQSLKVGPRYAALIGHLPPTQAAPTRLYHQRVRERAIDRSNKWQFPASGHV
ncbi:MAG: hypothetical protein SXG53_20890 [Pseudomonadota bacterium]|nr:hypothetical protein [Pseudomonadota bacterium]